MKGCNKCGVAKPLDEFYRDRHSPDGRRYSCKCCDNHRDADPDRIEARREYGLSEAGKAAYRRYRETPKGQAATGRFRESAARQAWLQTDGPRESQRRYNSSEHGRAVLRAKWISPERKEWRAKWRAVPEVHERELALGRLACHKRNAAIRNLPRSFTLPDWERCMTYFEDRCAYCGATGALVHEHFIPITAGGPYTPGNIVPACRRCNTSKKNRLPKDWCSPEAYHRILSYFASLSALA